MRVRSAALWALTAGAAAADWVAVATANRRLEVVAKPGAMVALGAAAVSSGLLERPWGRAHLTGLAFGLGGDVLLLGDGEAFFLAGLSSFLVGHLAYLHGFSRMGMRRSRWVAVGAAALAPSVALSAPALARLWADGGVVAVAPVGAYAGVIAAMSLGAWSTGDRLLGLGSSLFVLSDAVIAVDAFVDPVEQAGLKVMVPYLLAQALMAAAATRSGS
ncbi:hypothetical protein GCM10022199_23480 [Marihabitans asiaticum]|uniref:Putative membrane protein YhhN n=1 Tax=Marihabitans asiaticum TaxID=415218 RepID=A0A560W9Y5_9MICO|nr:lysoplasmalogenase family protein [Marihabitans asiaticum]TWD14431.1 putative membrane protein YhhN [Marihabitans asiaticum]